jgi:hypothetical protein
MESNNAPASFRFGERLHEPDLLEGSSDAFVRAVAERRARVAGTAGSSNVAAGSSNAASTAMVEVSAARTTVLYPDRLLGAQLTLRLLIVRQTCMAATGSSVPPSVPPSYYYSLFPHSARVRAC